MKEEYTQHPQYNLPIKLDELFQPKYLSSRINNTPIKFEELFQPKHEMPELDIDAVNNNDLIVYLSKEEGFDYDPFGVVVDGELCILDIHGSLEDLFTEEKKEGEDN